MGVGCAVTVGAPITGGSSREMRPERKSHDELAPGPRTGAEGLDGSPMQFDEPLHHRQSDAETSLRTLGTTAHLYEKPKDAFELVGWDSNPRVSDAYDRLPCLATCREPDPPTRLSVLAGILQEVAEHLRQPRGVRVEVNGLGWHRDFKGMIRSGHEWSARIGCMLHD